MDQHITYRHRRRIHKVADLLRAKTNRHVYFAPCETKADHIRCALPGMGGGYFALFYVVHGRRRAARGGRLLAWRRPRPSFRQGGTALRAATVSEGRDKADPRRQHRCGCRCDASRGVIAGLLAADYPDDDIVNVAVSGMRVAERSPRSARVSMPVCGSIWRRCTLAARRRRRHAAASPRRRLRLLAARARPACRAHGLAGPPSSDWRRCFRGPTLGDVVALSRRRSRRRRA